MPGEQELVRHRLAGEESMLALKAYLESRKLFRSRFWIVSQRVVYEVTGAA